MNSFAPPAPFDLTGYLDNHRRVIDQALEKIIISHFAETRLCHAMKYSLMASGKRLRPILCMAAAETVGEINPQVIAAACAIEMIHTYSLIHDDLPAMDNDALRRGKPTCHVQFDEATAVLAGDALLTFAFEIFASASVSPENAGIMLQVIRNVSTAAGHKGMIEGQMQDIAAEGIDMTLDALKTMHALKTGALIEASVASGALLAGGSESEIRQLEIYARDIGLAFQVVDDILNVEGDAGEMGKATGTDASRGKSTYPALLGLSQSKQFAAELINNALHALDIFGIKSTSLKALANYVIERKR
ncbi:MAG: polyprenyl synthetase family protein [Desulfobacteraceae bacterium]|nr:MAG: polyprenyl synthetase family protein [Desulfobacteraceae bacterium]